MRITISTPNDYGSDAAALAAIAECYGGDAAAATEDEGRELLEALALVAKGAGLNYAGATDFGAEWEGTAEQVAAARAALPAWAGSGIMED